MPHLERTTPQRKDYDDTHRFIETWAERKARAIAKKAAMAQGPQELSRKGKGRQLASGGWVTPAFVVKCHRLYMQGLPLKTIALEMECGKATVSRLRQEYNWPYRTTRMQGGKPAMHNFTVELPRTLLDAMERHIYSRYRSKRLYIMALIKKDIGNG